VVQGENPVSDAGVLALGRALEVNKTLQYLNLVSPNVSVAALCRFVACILPKDTFFEVSFRKFRIRLEREVLGVRIPVPERDNPPVSACVGCDSWLREGLAIPPRNVVLEGWSAVLGYLRTVSEYCRCFLKSSCTTRVSSNFLKRCISCSFPR
jgi:hypothetical protein